MENRETVLIADDSQMMCDLLEHELKDLGIHQCTKVMNGQEAVKAFKENKFDLVFLDINMPLIDGLQALQAIRLLDPKAYVVIASGAGTADKVKAAIKLGAKGFMVKPYSTVKLKEAVRNFRDAQRGEAS